jgi:hypothetical protein
MSQQPYYNAGAGGGGASAAPPVVVRGVYVSGDPRAHGHRNPGDNKPWSSYASQHQQQPQSQTYYGHSGGGGVGGGFGGVGGADGGGAILGDYERAGEAQPRRCNDVAFAILFYVNLGIMAVLAATFAPRMIGEISSASSSSSDAARDLMSSPSSSSSSPSTSSSSFAARMVGTAQRFVLSLPASHSHPPSRTSIVPPASGDGFRYLQEDGDGGDGGGGDVAGTDGLGDLILLLGASTLIALLLSSGALGFMIRHAESLIKFALLFNVVCTAVVSGASRFFSGLWSLAMFRAFSRRSRLSMLKRSFRPLLARRTDPAKFAVGAFFVSPFSAIVGVFLFVLTVYYAYVVWGRIPFAACNLVVATTAVRANLGLAAFAYSSLPVMFGWNCWWLVSFASTVYVTSGCDARGNCAGETPGALVFSMLLSYHWTYQVIKNVLHVTVAGVVGTWWFVPGEGASFCSRGVRDSFVRSVTTSFGSICLGSLLVAIIEALRSMVRNARDDGDGGIFLCLAECLLSCLQDVLEVRDIDRM